jgi:hypothetical protein
LTNRAEKFRCALGLAAALLLLNASLTFESVWPTPNIRWGNALSVELAAFVLLVAVAYRAAAGITRRAGPALWIALIAGHYLDVTASSLYGREFNVYWDSQHLGNVAGMLARAAPAWVVAAATAGLAIALSVTYTLARLALGEIAHAVSLGRFRLVLGAAAASVIALFTGQQIGVVTGIPLAFAEPVTPAYARQARFALGMFGPGAVAPSLAPSPDLNRELHRLAGADVLLIFVESYGAVAFDVPDLAAKLAPARHKLVGAVRETGRQMVTAYVDSPTFGASSWLAHLSLISGVEVRDQYAYTSLMASKRDTLLTNFSRRGYRTVALMPGMRQSWPEGAFYQFDQIYGRDLLDYDGPEFGWWSIPDQFALAKLDELERNRPSRKPLFVVFPTSTTHAPFGPVPPYQPDWSKLLTKEPFEPSDVEQAMAARPDLTNLGPSYVRAMAYEYASLAGYLRQHPQDNMLLIAIGDHQPPAAVSGPHAPWQVPVHVIGRAGPLLDAFVCAGFRPGIEPAEGPALDIPSAGCQYPLARFARLGPLRETQRARNSRNEPHSGPRRSSLGAMHDLVPLMLDAFDASVPVLPVQLDAEKGSRLPPTASATRPPSTGGP